jgi:lysine N6-hydroxylase
MNYDLIGIGTGPFNLSLAAMLKKTPITHKFFERSPSLNWHSEIIFNDSLMQTSFFKDLATSVDPTSEYTFLNYLVSNGLFHTFMNTNRTVVTRREYEIYLQWAASKMEDKINFGHEVKEISFKDNTFELKAESNGKIINANARNICIGTGITPRIPDFAKKLISKNVFHAKSRELSLMNLENKNVLIIGGGQTGIEIFRNALSSKWGKLNSIKLISNRINLQPLDESPFTNEYFTPGYVNCFFKLDQKEKDTIIQGQKLASDGNTPDYLEYLYNDLYRMKYIEKDTRTIEIMPNRKAHTLDLIDQHYQLSYFNHFTKKEEKTTADIVILCTGFENIIPEFIKGIAQHLEFDESNRFRFNSDFSLKWKLQSNSSSKVYALNFSRHGHGISEPQTSLMPWRSATIINSILKTDFYNINNDKPNFINFCRD